MSGRTVLPAIGRLLALGMDIEPLLKEAGVPRAALEDADARLPHEVALDVWHRAVRLSGDASLGIHAAESVRPGAFDVLDYTLRSSATLGEAWGRLTRYYRLLHDAAQVRLTVSGGLAHLTHALPPSLPPLPRQVAEFILTALMVASRQATGVDLIPSRVSFHHAAPDDVSEHVRVFRCEPRFEQPHNGVSVAQAVLETPLLKADSGLSTVLERHTRELLARLPEVQGLVERVRAHAAEGLASGGATNERIAKRLHMSVRTLHRRMRDEGTSLQEVVDTLRRELALRYLEDRRLAIPEVAYLLGFSEASAFHRAFRRWTGTTPAEHRRAPQAVMGDA
ncbi:Transcriptional regulator, AraC family [Myxococcus hansupus]|uniref:Transcriptional regulator, AraC family n=1 Tax=Pseudomyxococcus hansupus TaxID=1297742 RepID=A0A0H4WQR4_9BACT|nr:AraC family transcriptional regulator [Myxococcus hansupus]AKQ63923.1 Transcriptional regulator, AraC family [Myxococcus hansupus]